MRHKRPGADNSMNWPSAEAAALMAAHRWLSVLYSELGNPAVWAEAAMRHALFSKSCAGFALPPRAETDGPDSLEEVLRRTAEPAKGGPDTFVADELEEDTELELEISVTARSASAIVAQLERELDVDRLAQAKAADPKHKPTPAQLRQLVPRSIVDEVGHYQGRIGEVASATSADARDAIATRLEGPFFISFVCSILLFAHLFFSLPRSQRASKSSPLPSSVARSTRRSAASR